MHLFNGPHNQEVHDFWQMCNANNHIKPNRCHLWVDYLVQGYRNFLFLEGTLLELNGGPQPNANTYQDGKMVHMEALRGQYKKNPPKLNGPFSQSLSLLCL